MDFTTVASCVSKSCVYLLEILSHIGWLSLFCQIQFESLVHNKCVLKSLVLVGVIQGQSGFSLVPNARFQP